MAKLEPALASAHIKALNQADIPSAGGASASTAAVVSNKENRSVLSESESGVQDNAMIKAIYKEYYERGVNVLKPEIVLSSEFIPIRKSTDEEDNVGLNISMGSETVPVNQVLKLLELHRVVQESVNITSLEFINSTAGFDCGAVLSEMKEYYSSSVLSSTFEETVDAFLTHLESNFWEDPSAEDVMWGNLGLKTQIMMADVGGSGELIRAGIDSEGNIEYYEYVSFRNLIRSTDSFISTSIRTLAEIVILEKILFGVADYFCKIINLKSEILKLIDMTTMESKTSGVEDNLSQDMKKLFRAVDQSYASVPNFSSPTDYAALDGAQISGMSRLGQDSEPVWVTKDHASSFIGTNSLPKYALGADSISQASSNTLILYALFHRVLSLLDAQTTTVDRIDGEKIDDSGKGLTDSVKINYTVDDDTLSDIQKQIDTFLKIGLSSFSSGTKFSGYTRNSGNAQTWHFWTSRPYWGRQDLDNCLNHAWFKNADFEANGRNDGREVTADMYWNSVADDEDILPRGVVLKSNAYNDNDLRSISQLLSICLFDVMFDVNRVATQGVTNFFEMRSGSEVAGMIESREYGIRDYFRHVLGKHGANASNTDSSPFVNAVSGYAGVNTIKPARAAKDTGEFHDVFFSENKILEDELGMLPSETSGFDKLPLTLPGQLGIITEAFVNDNYDSLDAYIENITTFTEKFTNDILDYTGIGRGGKLSERSGYRNARGGASGTSSKGAHPPSYLAAKILQKFADGISSDYSNIVDEWSSHGWGALIYDTEQVIQDGMIESVWDELDRDPEDWSDSTTDKVRDNSRFSLALFFMILAGEDSSLGRKILTRLFSVVHYNQALINRGQIDSGKGKRTLKWFQKEVYDSLCSLVQIVGSEVFGVTCNSRKSTAREVEFKLDHEGKIDGYPTAGTDSADWLSGFSGQHRDYLSNQEKSDKTKAKNSAVWEPDDMSGKNLTFGNGTTSDIFESTLDKTAPILTIMSSPLVEWGKLNDAITDTFCPAGVEEFDEIGNFTSPRLPYSMSSPLDYLKTYIHDQNETYSSNRNFKYSSSNNDKSMIAGRKLEPWSEFAPEVSSFDGEPVTGFLSYLYFPENETVATTLGPYRTNETQRDFAIFASLCKLLHNSINVKVTATSSNLQFHYAPQQLQALIDALNGHGVRTMSDFYLDKPEFLKEADASEGSNTSKYGGSIYDSIITSEAEFNDLWAFSSDEDGSETESTEEGPGYELYEQTYSSTIDAMKDILSSVYDKENSMRVCLTAIIKHISNLNKIKTEITTVTSSGTQDKLTKLALEYTNNISEEVSTEEGRAIDDIKSSFLRSINTESAPILYKNIIDQVLNSSSAQLYTPNNSISEAQLHLMTTALTGISDSGLSSDEKMGKKSIVTVGLPPNLIETLKFNAYKGSGDINYYDSPYVCIHIFKKDSLGSNLLYYPKPFIFNADMITVENISSTNFAESDQITNASSISSYEDLLDNFSMYRLDYPTATLSKVAGSSGMLSMPNDLQYMSEINTDYDSSESSVRQIAMKEMQENHILDHYLKMYLKIATGLDVNEYVFPLTESARLNNTVDTSKVDLFNQYRDNLIVRYPAINVDPILAREFVRLEKNIIKSNFFSMNQKAKNVLSPKCFARNFTMFVNEADFVVCPNEKYFHPDGMMWDIGDTSIIENLADLYEPSPKFNLGSGKQIYGINPSAKSNLVYSAAVTSEYSSIVGRDSWSVALEEESGRTKKLLQHITEVETDNVPDVYELFAVVSVVRRA